MSPPNTFGVVQAVWPLAVMAWTLPSAFVANPSATPVELGTAGTILETPEPSPGFDQITVPVGNVEPVQTVTSDVALPAVIVALPAPTAVTIGGSSVESVTTAVLLEAQVSPVTDWPLELSASIGCVPPTSMLITLGTRVTEVPPPPPPPPRLVGTVNVTALLQVPFCCTLTIPLTAFEATEAVTCVLLHPITEP